MRENLALDLTMKDQINYLKCNENGNKLIIYNKNYFSEI